MISQSKEIGIRVLRTYFEHLNVKKFSHLRDKLNETFLSKFLKLQLTWEQLVNFYSDGKNSTYLEQSILIANLEITLLILQESTIKPCDSNPCLNQAIKCTNIDDNNDFVCTCQSSWTGKTCSTGVVFSCSLHTKQECIPVGCVPAAH